MNDRVPVHPELAQAALRDGLAAPFVSWSLLRSAAGGRGHLTRQQAIGALEEGRGVCNRQVRRLLGEGMPAFWTESAGRVWIAGVAAVAVRLGVPRVSRPHLVPVADLRKRTATKAALAATVYRTDEGGTPLTRRKVAELTGVPPSTQRRWESWRVRRVAQVHVQQAHVRPEATGALARAHKRWGMHVGRSGDLMRRHGDIRQVISHVSGSASAARRVNQEIVRRGRPAAQTRGERPLRANFLVSIYGSNANAAKAWTKATRALGKSAARREVFHPDLDYSVLEVVSRWGRRRWVSIREPIRWADIV